MRTHLQRMGGPDGHRIAATGQGPRRDCRRTAGRRSTTRTRRRRLSIPTVIAGGGPAGLTAAYELTKHGHSCVVLEADPTTGRRDQPDRPVQGLSFRHRRPPLLLQERRGQPDLARDPGRPVHHPLADEPDLLQPQVLPLPAQAGQRPAEPRLWRSSLVLASYLKARLRPIRPERSFEDWVVNRFGRVLFEIFFKTYTEKVWGMPTSEISADWAAQRIKGLSLAKAVWNALFGKRKTAEGRGDQDPDRPLPVPPSRSRPDVGGRPRPGPPAGGGGPQRPPRRPDRARRLGRHGVRRPRLATGRLTRYHGDHFLSTLPIRDLIRCLSPPPPREVVDAAESLKYRDFLTVVLIVDRPETFPDTWIYIHEPERPARPGPELQELVARPRPRPVQEQPRPRILLLRGRRPLDQVRRRPDRTRPPRDRRDRPGQGLRGHRRLRRPDAQGVPGLRRRLPGPSRRDPGLAQEPHRTSTSPAATGCTSTTTRTTR